VTLSPIPLKRRHDFNLISVRGCERVCRRFPAVGHLTHAGALDHCIGQEIWVNKNTCRSSFERQAPNPSCPPGRECGDTRQRLFTNWQA
jgi:hypothetical protein